MAKSVREARYFRKKIDLKSHDTKNVSSRCRLKLPDFSITYILHCSMHPRLSIPIRLALGHAR